MCQRLYIASFKSLPTKRRTKTQPYLEAAAVGSECAVAGRFRADLRHILVASPDELQAGGFRFRQEELLTVGGRGQAGA